MLPELEDSVRLFCPMWLHHNNHTSTTRPLIPSQNILETVHLTLEVHGQSQDAAVIKSTSAVIAICTVSSSERVRSGTALDYLLYILESGFPLCVGRVCAAQVLNLGRDGGLL